VPLTMRGKPVAMRQGKIRVYARIRPMLPFEAAKGQKAVLDSPDELSLNHMWKGAKREYNFDAVFMPDVPQEKVRALGLSSKLHGEELQLETC